MPSSVDSILAAGDPRYVGNPLTTAAGYQDLASKVQQYQQNQVQFPLQNQLTQASIANLRQDIQKTALGMNQQQQTYAAQKLSSMLSDSAPITQDKMTSEIQTLGGALDPAHIQSALSNMPQGGTDAQYRTYLTKLLIGNMAGPEAAQRILPLPGPDIQSPGGLQGSVRSPLTGPTPGAIIPSGSPVVQTIAPGIGVFTRQDGSQYAAPIGSGTARPGVGSGAGPGAPAAPATPFPGNVRPAAAPHADMPTPPAAPVQQPAPAAPDSFGTTALPSGTAESLKLAKDASTQAGITLTNTDSDRTQKQALLTDILTQAANPKAFTSPDAPAYRQLMARLGAVPGVLSPEVMAATAGQEQMEKAMANYQTLQMKSMIGTNAGLAQVIAGSPHIELSKMGLAANVHTLQGTLDYEGAMSKAWQSSPLSSDPSNFKTFQQQWISNHTDASGQPVQIDPRVFWMSHMDSKAFNEFYKNTSDKAQLRRNYDYAVNQGLIPKSGQ